VLQIDGQTLLVAVEHREESGPGRLQPPRVIAFQRLDLDDFGAEVR
jgi:hypothetical protein